MKTITPTRFLAVATLLTTLSGAVWADNTNTTIQPGQINTNDTDPRGCINDNA